MKQKSLIQHMNERNAMQLSGGDPPKTTKDTTRPSTLNFAPPSNPFEGRFKPAETQKTQEKSGYTTVEGYNRNKKSGGGTEARVFRSDEMGKLPESEAVSKRKQITKEFQQGIRTAEGKSRGLDSLLTVSQVKGENRSGRVKQAVQGVKNAIMGPNISSNSRGSVKEAQCKEGNCSSPESSRIGFGSGGYQRGGTKTTKAVKSSKKK
jgi:hypothetical protein